MAKKSARNTPPIKAKDIAEVPAHEVGRLTLPRQVRDKENDYINERRVAAGVEPTTDPVDKTQKPAPLVGMSFSGGGIRAATFCLGILQTLGRTDILRLVDYLCTVSGGGYLGACFSSLMTQPSTDPDTKQPPATEVRWKRHAGDDAGQRMPLLCSEQVHHLRKHGDFLLLGRGTFSRELLRSFGHLVTGWIGSFGIFLLLMLTFAAAFMAYTSGLAGSDLWSNIENSCITWDNLPLTLQWPPSWALVWGLAFGLIGDVVIAGFRRQELPPGIEAGETAEDRRERFYIMGFTLALLIAGVAITLIGADRAARTSGNLMLIPSFFVGSFVAATCFYLLCSNVPSWWNKSTRSVYAATVTSSLYLVIVSLVLLGIVWGIAWFTKWLEADFAAWLVSVGGVSGIASRVMSGIRMSPGRSDKLSSTQQFGKSLLFSIAQALSVAIFVMSVFTLGVYLLMELKATHVYIQLMAAAAFLILFGMWGFLIDFNRIGIHYFYRDRLVETYLQTETRINGRLETARDDSALRVKDLHTWENSAGTANPAPYHLILCALNLAGSKDLTRKDRKSDHFIFSREYCGSTTTGYIATKDYRDGKTELATAMTISGAAASSAMGFYTSALQAFATTLFNIRLGRWLVNPRVYDHEPGKVVYSGHATPPKFWSEELAGRREFGTHVRTWHERFAFWPVYLFRESMLLTTARSALINLSDGGHTGDNIGLYPLFQRSCRLIIACDGEADPDYGFASFASAIRQIYIDENVRVQIDLDQLRPDKAGEPAKQHYLIGRIVYPPSTRLTIPEAPELDAQRLKDKHYQSTLDAMFRKAFEANRLKLSEEATIVPKFETSEDSADPITEATNEPPKQWTVTDGNAAYEITHQNREFRVTGCGDPDSEESEGWLIYLKSSLLKQHEPAAVTSYAVMEPFFPHQTTGDQLFDDDQFEAYRMLGEHIAETMLVDAGLGSKSAGTGKTANDLMKWCKEQWRPSRLQVLAALQERGGDEMETANWLGCKVDYVKKMLAEETK